MDLKLIAPLKRLNLIINSMTFLPCISAGSAAPTLLRTCLLTKQLMCLISTLFNFILSPLLAREAWLSITLPGSIGHGVANDSHRRDVSS